MNKSNIIKIAKLLVESGKIEKNVARNLIENLNRRELSLFSRILQKFENESTVKVFSEKPLPGSLKKEIAEKFKKKRIYFMEKQNMGDGIMLMINDTIIDLTVESFLASTIEKLKSS